MCSLIESQDVRYYVIQWRRCHRHEGKELRSDRQVTPSQFLSLLVTYVWEHSSRQ